MSSRAYPPPVSPRDGAATDNSTVVDDSGQSAAKPRTNISPLRRGKTDDQASVPSPAGRAKPTRPSKPVPTPQHRQPQHQSTRTPLRTPADTGRLTSGAGRTVPAPEPRSTAVRRPAAPDTVRMDQLPDPRAVGLYDNVQSTLLAPTAGHSGLGGNTTGAASVPPANRHNGSGPLIDPFGADSVEEPKQRPVRFRRTRRVAQGGVLMGLVASIAAVMAVMPGEDGESLLARSGATNRIQATAIGPVATADQLVSSIDAEVDGSLSLRSADGQESAEPDNETDRARLTIAGAAAEETTDGSSATSASQAENAEGSADAGTGRLDGGQAGGGTAEVALGPTTTTTTAEQTTTTVWVEPTLPPESEWIDGGNGVMLPDILLRIRFCESTNDYEAAHIVSSARGAYQFLSMSWEWYGHAERYGVAAANLAAPAQQDEAALLTLQQDGTRPWAASRGCWANPELDARYLTAKPPSTTTTLVTDETTTTLSDETTTSLEEAAAEGEASDVDAETTTSTSDSTTTSESTDESTTTSETTDESTATSETTDSD